MEIYPAQLQQKLLIDNFSIEMGDTLVRSGMDVGPDKVRSRYTDGVDVYNCAIDMDIDDYDVLLDFYKTTLNNGAHTFGFLDPMTNEDGEFRFKAPPAITPIGGRIFRINMVWEKLP